MRSKNRKVERVEQIIPPIPDTPENVARAIMQGPPKGKWEFLNKTGTPKAKSKKKPAL